MPAPVIDLTGDTPPPRRQTRSSARLQQLQASASQQPPQPSTATSTHISLIPTSSSSSFNSHHSDFQISPIPWSLRSPPNSPLLRKRAWLRSHSISLPPGLSRRSFSGFSSGSDPIGATLVFAQEEAGTAVCVSPDGVLLTCAHCIAEDPAELDPARLHPLLFSSGAVVTARVAAWDPTRDLALLVIAEVESEQVQPADHVQKQRPRFPYVRIAGAAPRPRAPLICIGHPGSEDLEATGSGPAPQTGYDTLVASAGTFRGLAPGQDVQDNSEIGALAHTCWTYWGHSGAGLIDRRTGDLVGLHSSWDDETGMRRGVAWEAVSAFLAEFDEGGASGTRGVPEGWRWCVRA